MYAQKALGDPSDDEGEQFTFLSKAIQLPESLKQDSEPNGIIELTPPPPTLTRFTITKIDTNDTSARRFLWEIR